MMTEVLQVDPQQPAHAAIARAAACLREGGLVAFPTETVYGLGVHALDAAAVRRLFEAKGRPSHDPVIVHLANLDEARVLASELPAAARSLAERFWPGPLTMVVRRAASVPDEVTAGLDTVAVRVPAHRVAHALLTEARIPVAAPSANLFSRPSPTTADHVLQDLEGRIDVVLDAGPTTVGVESTVVDLTRNPPVLLRPGAVNLEVLRTVIPDLQEHASVPATGQTPLPSPGLLPKHYAPRTPMTLYRGPALATGAALIRDARAALEAGRRVGVLATREHATQLDGLPVLVADLGSGSDPGQVAGRLYAALRELDASDVDIILAHDFQDDSGLWRAIRDRLRRASSRTVIVE